MPQHEPQHGVTAQSAYAAAVERVHRVTDALILAEARIRDHEEGAAELRERLSVVARERDRLRDQLDELAADVGPERTPGEVTEDAPSASTDAATGGADVSAPPFSD